jgi:hypothetical protein
MAELVKCRTCKHPIDRDAHTCPHCGAPDPAPAQEPKSCAKGCLGVFVGFCVLIFVSAMMAGSCTPTPTQEPTPSAQSTTVVPQYTIVEDEYVNYANVVRKSYRVRVPKILTKPELTAISNKIVREATAHERVKAIMIFYYLPESDHMGFYTAGKATWAPGGDWAKADTNLVPKLVIDTRTVLPKDCIVDLPLKTKQQIYMQIVRDQDREMSTDQSYAAAARQFGITTDQASKIIIEGLHKGWEMPPLAPSRKPREALDPEERRRATADTVRVTRAAQERGRAAQAERYATEQKAEREAAKRKATAAKAEAERKAALAKAESQRANAMVVRADWPQGIAWVDLAKWEALSPAQRTESVRILGSFKALETGTSTSLKLKASPDGPLLAICYKDGKPQLMRKQDRE